MLRRSLLCASLLMIAHLAAAVPPSPPSAPQDLQYDDALESVTFEWLPPALDGGAPVAGYTVHLVLNGEPLEPVEVLGTSYTLDGIADDDAVIIAVSAFNVAGSGPFEIGVRPPAPYPRCSAFGYTIDPPNYRLRPECLVPSEVSWVLDLLP